MMATKYRVACDGCPFEGEYTSQARADYHFGRHSCDRHNRIAELRARGEARKASIDRTPKPCLHKEADHVHGTYACYVLDFCRCDPCRAANRVYENSRVRQQAYGRWNGLVDAEPARQHIRSLMSQGMGLKRIVAVSGIAQGVLWKLLYGKRKRLKSGKLSKRRTPSKRIRPETEQRILAVELDLADGAIVDSIGAVRRIQALVALGWSLSKIADRLGILRSNFTNLAHGRTDVTVGTDKAVRALYDEWSMQLPPQAEWRDEIAANRARNYAMMLGWFPPLAWDDDSLDDPDAIPFPAGDAAPGHLDETAVARRIAGDRSVALTHVERGELVRRMRAEGFSHSEIERRTGVNPRRQHASPSEGVSA